MTFPFAMRRTWRAVEEGERQAEMTKDKFEFIANALIANDLMEQTRNYLEGGRKFESLTLDQLRDKW